MIHNATVAHFSQYLTHFCHHPFSAFCLVVLQLSSAEISTLPNFAARFCFIELSFGRMPILTRRFTASTFQEVFARLSIELPGLAFASDVAFSRRTSASWCWWLRGWRGLWCRFCTIVTLMPETALVSLRTLPFFFPLATNTFPHSTPLNPLRLLTTALVSMFSFLASKFRNRSF